MNKERTQTPFTLEFTQDGSPTLRFAEGGESMHHSAGAALETRYIYKTPLQLALKQLNNCDLHVLGLGLGYIEISWAIEVYKINQLKLTESTLTSFEVEPELVESFINWVNAPDSIESVYNQICKHLDPEVPVSKIKKILLKNLTKTAIKGNLLHEFKNSQKVHIICFDAFSSKTTKELWSAEFLDAYIKKCAQEDCLFTTYACTGILKRVLKDNGFEMIPRFRFKSWRDSTLAVRGVFKTAAMTYQTS
jgi:tRNA U34 5-methylaminomethyl-2-thiouridine-forming methyltransferase MnmC